MNAVLRGKFSNFQTVTLAFSFRVSSLFTYKQAMFLFTLFSLTSLVCFAQSKGSATQAKSKHQNVLFIPIDDLRLDIGVYGNKVVKTPNIDRLAADGVAFSRAYCQQALCTPSRSSLLTGLRPDAVQVWDLAVHFRENIPNAVTLPQFFKNQGYNVVGYGKTFHSSLNDSISWTEEPNRVTNRVGQQFSQTAKPGQALRGPSLDSSDVSDDTYKDGEQTTQAIAKLKELKEKNKPFFLSVGYMRPHLPFVAPKKYWDLYKRSDLPLATNQFVPKGSPEFAVHGDSELRQYSDRRDLPKPWEKPLDLEKQREQLHAYYACISYVDVQIGRLLDELDRLGLKENTTIVLWGDHGWKLGEHNSWGKMSNYEIDTNAPLIFSGAGVSSKGKVSNAITEFLDIYPTLQELTGFKVSAHLQGKSLKPVLDNPKAPHKKAAFSQYLLGRFGTEEYQKEERMGYAIRTERYRYVEWYLWEKDTKKKGKFLASELFDHKNDPKENVNLAVDNTFQQTAKQLSQQLRSEWK